ncbi:MAG: hypothetical protein ACM3X4_04375 [Ignavibacteriales bacterium]
MTPVIALAVVAGCAALSVRARAVQIRRAYEVRDAGGVEPAPSHLSTALQETLATAAGIYVALSALSTFLKIEMPAVPLPWGFSVDPVPALAVLLAIIQPVFGRG